MAFSTQNLFINLRNPSQDDLYKKRDPLAIKSYNSWTHPFSCSGYFLHHSMYLDERVHTQNENYFDMSPFKFIEIMGLTSGFNNTNITNIDQYLCPFEDLFKLSTYNTDNELEVCTCPSNSHKFDFNMDNITNGFSKFITDCKQCFSKETDKEIMPQFEIEIELANSKYSICLECSESNIQNDKIPKMKICQCRKCSDIKDEIKDEIILNTMKLEITEKPCPDPTIQLSKESMSNDICEEISLPCSLKQIESNSINSTFSVISDDISDISSNMFKECPCVRTLSIIQNDVALPSKSNSKDNKKLLHPSFKKKMNDNPTIPEYCHVSQVANVERPRIEDNLTIPKNVHVSQIPNVRCARIEDIPPLSEYCHVSQVPNVTYTHKLKSQKDRSIQQIKPDIKGQCATSKQQNKWRCSICKNEQYPSIKTKLPNDSIVSQISNLSDISNFSGKSELELYNGKSLSYNWTCGTICSSCSYNSDDLNSLLSFSDISISPSSAPCTPCTSCSSEYSLSDSPPSYCFKSTVSLPDKPDEVSPMPDCCIPDGYNPLCSPDVDKNIKVVLYHPRQTGSSSALNLKVHATTVTETSIKYPGDDEPWCKNGTNTISTGNLSRSDLEDISFIRRAIEQAANILSDIETGKISNNPEMKMIVDNLDPDCELPRCDSNFSNSSCSTNCEEFDIIIESVKEERIPLPDCCQVPEEIQKKLPIEDIKRDKPSMRNVICECDITRDKLSTNRIPRTSLPLNPPPLTNDVCEECIYCEPYYDDWFRQIPTPLTTRNRSPCGNNECPVISDLSESDLSDGWSLSSCESRKSMKTDSSLKDGKGPCCGLFRKRTKSKVNEKNKNCNNDRIVQCACNLSNNCNQRTVINSLDLDTASLKQKKRCNNSCKDSCFSFTSKSIQDSSDSCDQCCVRSGSIYESLTSQGSVILFEDDDDDVDAVPVNKSNERPLKERNVCVCNLEKMKEKSCQFKEDKKVKKINSEISNKEKLKNIIDYKSDAKECNECPPKENAIIVIEVIIQADDVGKQKLEHIVDSVEKSVQGIFDVQPSLIKSKQLNICDKYCNDMVRGIQQSNSQNFHDEIRGIIDSLDLQIPTNSKKAIKSNPNINVIPKRISWADTTARNYSDSQSDDYRSCQSRKAIPTKNFPTKPNRSLMSNIERPMVVMPPITKRNQSAPDYVRVTKNIPLGRQISYRTLCPCSKNKTMVCTCDSSQSDSFESSDNSNSQTGCNPLNRTNNLNNNENAKPLCKFGPTTKKRISKHKYQCSSNPESSITCTTNISFSHVLPNDNQRGCSSTNNSVRSSDLDSYYNKFYDNRWSTTTLNSFYLGSERSSDQRSSSNSEFSLPDIWLDQPAYNIAIPKNAVRVNSSNIMTKEGESITAFLVKLDDIIREEVLYRKFKNIPSSSTDTD